MPAQAQGSRRQPPGLLSFSSGSLERGAGAGERAERTGAAPRVLRGAWGKLGSPRGRARGAVPPPHAGGVGEILVSLLGFSVSCKTLGLRGPGCERWDRAPAPPSRRKAPAWGRDPAGATWAGAGARPPLSLCPSARAGTEGLLLGGSARLALSEGQHRSPATFVRSLFNLHGSRCDPDSPINPASVILFYSPPLPSLLPFFFGRVQTSLWSLFLFLVCFSLSRPVAPRFPASSSPSFAFLLQPSLPPLQPPPLQNWCSLDNLQSLNPPPAASQLGWAGTWQRDAPGAPPCLAAPLPKSTRQSLALRMRSPTPLGC